jgi:hypothetical protein
VYPASKPHLILGAILNEKLSLLQVNKALNAVSGYNTVSPVGFENDLPVSIKDYNFLDKETCSCFKSMSGSFPYSPQFSKAKEK